MSCLVGQTKRPANAFLAVILSEAKDLSSLSAPPDFLPLLRTTQIAAQGAPFCLP
jgi:hypothetical protein